METRTIRPASNGFLAKLNRKLKSFRKDTRAASALEYGLLLGSVAIGGGLLITAMTTKVSTAVTNIANKVGTAKVDTSNGKVTFH